MLPSPFLLGAPPGQTTGHLSPSQVVQPGLGHVICSEHPVPDLPTLTIKNFSFCQLQFCLFLVQNIPLNELLCFASSPFCLEGFMDTWR